MGFLAIFLMNICEVFLIPLCHDFVPADYLTNLVAIALLFLLDRLSQPLGILPPTNINRTVASISF